MTKITEFTINMSPENQRLAIAKVVGAYKTRFRFSSNYHNNKRIISHFDTIEEAKQKHKYQKNNYGDPSDIEEFVDLSKIPDYLNDLNAMHKAEMVMDIDERGDYAELLGINDPIYGHEAVLASAVERAKAFLKVFNLWEE